MEKVIMDGQEAGPPEDDGSVKGLLQNYNLSPRIKEMPHPS